MPEEPRIDTATVGDVLQVDPSHDDVFGGCFLTVTEPRPWGVHGFVRIPGKGDAFYRAPWAALVSIGRAQWVPSGAPEPADA